MKRYIIVATVIIVLIIMVWGIWALIASKNSQTSGSTQMTGSLPPVQIKTQGGASVPVQNVSGAQNSAVAQDFISQVGSDTDQIALGGTVVASPYALQIWGDANTGGEALLEQTTSGDWHLISLAGGQWTILALMQEGVPQVIAQQLITGIGATQTSASSTPITIPSGDTLTIGTANGNVVMNNFYANAAYIAQEQNAVVIEQSSTYDVVYNVPDSSFTISIFSLPFTTSRQSAEAAFLHDLNISQQDACKLKAYEVVPAGLSSQYAGESFPLSFCGITQPSE